MHSISQKLALASYYDSGEPIDKAEFDELANQAYQEFWATPTGQALIARDVDVERFVQVFYQRFGDTSCVSHKGVPFVERLLEIGEDMLVELPKPVAPKAQAPVKPAVNLTPAKPISTVSKEASQFAYMWNDQMLKRGIESCKQKGGTVTLEQNGKQYVYPAAQAEALLNEALSFGLIR